MSPMSVFVGALVLGGGFLQQPAVTVSQASGHLRWVRGTITEISPASLSVALRDKVVTIGLDQDTQMVGPDAVTSTARPSVGSLVEVHYTDKKKVQRAVLILSGQLGRAKMPRRAGYSYRSVISRIKNRDIDVRVDTKNRRVKMDNKSQLTGVDGQPLAAGWKTGTAQLSAGEEILVTWDQQEDDFIVLEIRKLPPSSLGS